MFLHKGAILFHDEAYWAALELTWSRHIGYAGPSLVQRRGSSEVLYAEADAAGNVTLRRPQVLHDAAHPQFRAEPGPVVGTSSTVVEMLFDDATASADPFAEHP